MADKLLSSTEQLRNRIFLIRGEQVMLDFDLAELYGYEVKVLNQQVKRNIKRFPDDFMFQLSKNELNSVKSQIVTSRKETLFAGQSGGTRKLPYAFTEQGIYMLATVLRGELAEQQSIFIMRAFRELRHYVQQNQQFVTKSELHILTEAQAKTASDVYKLQQDIAKINENFLLNEDFKEFVIYKGQKFEADKAYTDIYKAADTTIFVIDDYVNIKTLDLIKHKKTGVTVTLFTENKRGRNGTLSNSLVADFNSEYPSLSIKSNPDCHDRFIVLDYKSEHEQVFHCGASSKDAGEKVCSINKIENTALIHPVIDKLLSQPDKIL